MVESIHIAVKDKDGHMIESSPFLIERDDVSVFLVDSEGNVMAALSLKGCLWLEDPIKDDVPA